MDTRRLFLAMALAMAVYLLYTQLYPLVFGPPQPAVPVSAPGPQLATAPASDPTTVPAPGSPPRLFSFTAGPEETRLRLGGGPQDALEVELSSRGAALRRILLTAQRNERYVHRQAPRGNEPYELLHPIPAGDSPLYSFATRQVTVTREGQAAPWPLDELVWETVEQTAYRAAFATTLRAEEGEGALLRLVKTYELRPGTALITLRLAAENLSEAAYQLSFKQDGPLGIPREEQQYDMRRVLAAGRAADGTVKTIKALQRGDFKDGERVLADAGMELKFLWTSLSNKYFGVFTRPLPTAGATADYVFRVVALKAAPGIVDENPGDLLARIETVAAALAPGQKLEYTFEIYAGTKDAKDLKAVSPAFADTGQLGYVLAQAADYYCCCTFMWLTDLMVGLLDLIHRLVRNYGVAIMVLVLIVRTLLHPLTVFQQKSMFRTQEGMSRLQPKMAELKQRYGNDRVKYNQEMMKLYGEEGVNPMAPMVGMLPMFLQMPILIALWTGLNTDVHLRHAPLPLFPRLFGDGWWIDDLSAPDELIQFPGGGITIPILGWLPFIGYVFSNISALNVLPLVMGISMWLQQKYMPKPHLEARKQAAGGAKKPERNALGMTPEEQLRQQQMIGYLMCFMFPLLFYYMPSGLNLYWMATNVFGICESLIIRKQLRQERERRERLGPTPQQPRKASFLARFFKQLAEQAGDLQKRADEISRQPARTPQRLRKEKLGKRPK